MAVHREMPQVHGPDCQEKPLGVEGWVLVPQTDTGRRVEDTQANGRTFVKEFGKLAPYVRQKGRPPLRAGRSERALLTV
jgi:hypothetical protein